MIKVQNLPRALQNEFQNNKATLHVQHDSVSQTQPAFLTQASASVASLSAAEIEVKGESKQ